MGKLASDVLFCSAVCATLYSEHESAYCAIQTGIKQERIKSTDFRTCTKVRHVLVLADYHFPCNTASYIYLFRRNRVLQQWSTNSYVRHKTDVTCLRQRLGLQRYNTHGSILVFTMSYTVWSDLLVHRKLNICN